MKYITLLVFVIIVESCTVAKNNEYKVNNSVSLNYKPSSYLTYECGENKCGGDFTITSQFSDGFKNLKYIDYQIQSVFDSSVIFINIINGSEDKCELIALDTINNDKDSELYIELNSIRRELEKYKGELSGPVSCFDSPRKSIIWGNQDRCEYAYSFCKEKPILLTLIKKYEETISKRICKSGSLSCFTRKMKNDG